MRLAGEAVIDLQGDFVLPGFVDAHIHAFRGHDTMQGEDAIRQMARELYQEGVAAFLPTTMSASVEDTRRVIAAVRRVERQHDGAFPRHAVADPAPEVFGGVFGQGGQFAVGGDCRSGTEREDPFAGRRLFRGGLRRGGAQAAKGCRQEDQKS